MVKTAETVRDTLKQQGYACSLINARFAKPLDESLLRTIASEHKLIVTMEENVASGGFGERVRAYIDTLKTDVKLITVNIPDEYVEHIELGDTHAYNDNIFESVPASVEYTEMVTLVD